MHLVSLLSALFKPRDPDEKRMSQDPGSFYEDEYWETIGRQEDIAAELKRLSEGPIREYLGTNGDAI